MSTNMAAMRSTSSRAGSGSSALLALTFVFDLVDTLLKGVAHFERYGVEYLVRTPLYVALCIAAMFFGNRKLHAAFVIGSLVYEASWIVRQFRTLT